MYIIVEGKCIKEKKNNSWWIVKRSLYIYKKSKKIEMKYSKDNNGKMKRNEKNNW